MAEKESLQAIREEAREAQRNALLHLDDDPGTRITSLAVLMDFYAWFSIHVIDPYIPPTPKHVHMPDSIEGSEKLAEHVYPIMDFGDILATSKATEMYAVGYSQCKLYYTIEKMIWILHDRLSSSEVGEEDEVQIAIHGQPAAMRYAFASVINMRNNITISNFDPGDFGDEYLAMVTRLAEKNLGYPPESPREMFRKPHGEIKKP